MSKFNYKEALSKINTSNYKLQDELKEKHSKQIGRPKTSETELRKTTMFLGVDEIEYLKEKGYRERTNMTRYLRSLIQKDMGQNPL